MCLCVHVSVSFVQRRHKEIRVEQKKQDDRDRLIDFASVEIFGFVVWIGQSIVGEAPQPKGGFNTLGFQAPAENFGLGSSRDLTFTTLRCLPRRPPLTSFTSARYRRTLLSPLLQAAQDIVIRPPSTAFPPPQRYSPWVSVTAWSRTSSSDRTFFCSAHIGSTSALLDGETVLTHTTSFTPHVVVAVASDTWTCDLCTKNA